MSTPVKSQEELADQLYKALYRDVIDSTDPDVLIKYRNKAREELIRALEEGADPLHETEAEDIITGKKSVICPMKTALNQVFDISCTVENIDGPGERALLLLHALKRPLPQHIADIAKEKKHLPDEYWNGSWEIPAGEEKNYETKFLYVHMVWNDVRQTIEASKSYFKLRDMAKNSGGLAMPDSPPVFQEGKHCAWPGTRPVCKQAEKILGLLLEIAKDDEYYAKIFHDITLWRSPEDRYEFARLVPKVQKWNEEDTITRIPPVVYRGLNEKTAATHLAKYLSKDNEPSGRGGKA